MADDIGGGGMMAGAIPPPIDPEKDRADYDAATKILEAPERVLWIVYQILRNVRGFSSDRAAHEIARLAPRKT